MIITTNNFISNERNSINNQSELWKAMLSLHPHKSLQLGMEQISSEEKSGAFSVGSDRIVTRDISITEFVGYIL